MLTDHDIQARYIAATLGVIETELHQLNIPASSRRALSALVACTAAAATRLANELAPCTPLEVRETTVAHGDGNVLRFSRRT